MLRHTPLILILALAASAPGQHVHPRRSPPPPHDPAALEVVHYGPSGKPSGTTYLSRESLLRLHQVSAELKPDENFPELPAAGVRVTGVDLETLLEAVPHIDRNDALVAICRDGYTSPFPRKAVLEHHPILVLTMNGLTPHEWALKNHTYDPSPYFIAYQDFIPSFHILAHQDWAQSPAELIRLRILPPSHLDDAIRPASANTLPQDSPVILGFQIARQNCIRCHNAGETGGTKAQHSWQQLAKIAKDRPQFFMDLIHDPKSVNAHAYMPANLKYDQATLKALTRYFQTFAP